ncbi:MAG: hypothetical protein ACREGF_05000, partial [Candidatus Saccharimonadales bacterium]
MKFSAIISRARKFLASNIFFGYVMVWFVLESAWTALSAVYPMAFDEEVHFGLIKFYAHHLSPFVANQSAST